MAIILHHDHVLPGSHTRSPRRMVPNSMLCSNTNDYSEVNQIIKKEPLLESFYKETCQSGNRGCTRSVESFPIRQTGEVPQQSIRNDLIGEEGGLKKKEKGMKTFSCLQKGRRDGAHCIRSSSDVSDGRTNKTPTLKCTKFLSVKKHNTRKQKLHNAQSLNVRIVAAHIQQQTPPTHPYILTPAYIITP